MTEVGSSVDERIGEPRAGGVLSDYPGMTDPSVLNVFWRGSSKNYSSGEVSSLSRSLPDPPPDNRCLYVSLGNCGKGDQASLWWCPACEDPFCKPCWVVHKSHRNRKHLDKRIPFHDYEFIESVYNTGDISHAIKKNEETKWFGVNQDEKGSSFFTDYGGFVQLASSAGRDPAQQYPCLISFVGETGAGKSTIIRSLITLRQNDKSKSESKYRPVVGEPNSTTPTSGDVHIFADPASFTTTRPLYYADCEGLNGGGQIPKASGDRSKTPLERAIHYSQVMWMNRKIDRSTRQWTVENLYPRVLFTFSDVVCFVTKNGQTIEQIFTQLLLWADSALEKSVNQPILPHAILIINACEDTNDPKLWDENHTTVDVLEQHKSFFWDEPRLEKIVTKWKTGRTQNINLEAMLRVCFSSFKIIRIPNRLQSPAILIRQNERLYKEINSVSGKAERARRKSSFLLSSQDLDSYIRSAWKHFSKKPGPFNFLNSALCHRPIPSDLVFHIRAVIRQTQASRPQRYTAGKVFFKNCRLIASYIFIHAIREGYPSTDHNVIFSKYKTYCDLAVREFFEKDHICEKIVSGSKCCNAAIGHSKGHQSASGTLLDQHNRRFYIEMPVEEVLAKFTGRITRSLRKLLNRFRGLKEGVAKEQEEGLANKMHWGCLGSKRYCASWGHSARKSHTTCFGCLSGTPTHALFCGHVFCNRCIQGLAAPRELHEQGYTKVTWCPLCPDSEWKNEWLVEEKPAEVGLRVLTLDGGGVRSIMQLIILERLEQEIGLKIPIHSFFDLIVGTSGGGIVALGLGTQGWSVTECKNQFLEFAKTAFKRRNRINLVWQHSTYKTEGIESALKGAFGKDLMFGGIRETQKGTGTRVAVTSTCFRNTGGALRLITNYKHERAKTGMVHDAADSSAAREKKPYDVFNPISDHQELKIWEAARATSAAPGYYEPFYHSRSGIVFEDGGLKMNNPVVAAFHEMLRLWPQKARDPDLFLSIGTGFITKQPTSEEIRHRHGLRGLFKRAIMIAKDQLESTLDCNQAWYNFLLPINGPAEQEKWKRFHRLNVEFTDTIPKFDEPSAINHCQKLARDFCDDPENWNFRQVRAKLIASLFYFRPVTVIGSECKGHVLCRLEAGSESIVLLVNMLKRQQKDPWLNTFCVTDKDSTDEDDPTEVQFRVPGEVISEVARYRKEFLLRIKFPIPTATRETRIYLQLSTHRQEKVLISGSPRSYGQNEKDRRKSSDTVRRRYQDKMLQNNDTAF